MNFQFYFEKLMHSEEFQKFKKENPTAFLCSGFFSIDKKNQNNGDNQQHLDYFIPETKKLFSFRFIKGNIELIPTENFNENFEFEKIPDNLDFDFNKVERII